MDTYSLLREIADSWVLLAMFTFFVGTAVWAFWPSQNAAREDASMIPFRNDTDIVPSTGSRRGAAAKGDVQKPEGRSNV